MTLSSLRIRLNKSRYLIPQLCLSTHLKSVYGMRSVTNPSTNYQVQIRSARGITVGKQRISHAQYYCQCNQVAGVGCEQPACKGKAVCYHSLAAVRQMAREKGKRVIFYRNLSSALLKRKICKGMLIEVINGNFKIYGVAYGESQK